LLPGTALVQKEIRGGVYAFHLIESKQAKHSPSAIVCAICQPKLNIATSLFVRRIVSRCQGTFVEQAFSFRGIGRWLLAVAGMGFF
jgi:hypothetical protein